MEMGNTIQRSLNLIMSSGNHFVYILRCKDETYYTGYARDINNRLKMHEEGKGAKYTRGRGPFTIVYEEEFLSKSEALKREYEIKTLSRREKHSLITEQRGEQDGYSAKLP